jgi:hypothetical protein
MEGLYATQPVYFDDEFASCSTPDGTLTIVWLVPITAAEASYIRSVGWPRWEDDLAAVDPDLTSLRRASLQ